MVFSNIAVLDFMRAKRKSLAKTTELKGSICIFQPGKELQNLKYL